MPTYFLQTDDAESGQAEWGENSGGGLTPEEEASMLANWPRNPDELHLWAPFWAAGARVAADTALVMDNQAVVVADTEGMWIWAVGATGGGDQGYVITFSGSTTMFGSASFTPSAARVTYISTLVSDGGVDPVVARFTLRLYGTDINGDYALLATFQNPVEGFTVLVTGAAPASQNIPLSGLAEEITGRLFMTINVLIGTDDVGGLANNIAFAMEGIHLTFT